MKTSFLLSAVHVTTPFYTVPLEISYSLSRFVLMYSPKYFFKQHINWSYIPIFFLLDFSMFDGKHHLTCCYVFWRRYYLPKCRNKTIKYCKNYSELQPYTPNSLKVRKYASPSPWISTYRISGATRILFSKSHTAYRGVRIFSDFKRVGCNWLHWTTHLQRLAINWDNN